MNSVSNSSISPDVRSVNELPTELYTLDPRRIWAQVKREHIAFWFACGYLFFEYVRPQTIYPAIGVLPWASLFVLGALAASFVDKTDKSDSSSISKYIVIYGVIVLLSAFFAYQPEISFQYLGDYFNWIIIYFAIVRTVRTKARFFIFFTLYMLCNFKMTQHGFIAWAVRGFAFTSYGIGGAPGWFQNSGEFGIQLCIFTPLVVAFVLAVRAHTHRFVRLVLYVIPITAVGSAIATTSRGALVGLIAAALWSLKTTKYFVRAFVLIAIAGTITYFAIPPEFKARFENSGSDRTSVIRLDRWEKGWETMKDYPLFGVGHRNWSEYYGDKLDYGIEGTRLLHNMFIESGAEHGFTGLITLLLLLLATFVVNAKTRKLAETQGDRFSIYVAHALDAGTLGMIISSCFVTVLYYPYVWIQAAFVAALSISVRYGHKPLPSWRRATIRDSRVAQGEASAPAGR